MPRELRAALILFFWLVLIGSAHADKRVALVIGNADYQSVPRLMNPINDAAAIGAALNRLGFSVQSETDLGFQAMHRVLQDFAGTSAGADVAVIYYAGHGIEIGGQNYLIPNDAKLASDVDVPYEAISLDLALGALDGARGTRLLILDACRNNPFAAKMRAAGKSRSIGRGLAAVEPSVGTIVAYAAKEGTVSEDGDVDHSPFTKALLQHIEEPGIDIQFLFRKVRDTVLEATNGKQEPFTYGSLPGKTVLLSPVPTAMPTTPANSENEIAAEVAFWNTVKDTGDSKLLESYLRHYPQGRFADLASILIARLAPPAQAPSPPAQAPSPPAVFAPPQLTDYQVAGQQRGHDIMGRMGQVNWASLGRWIQAASRQDLNEAIVIASEISQQANVTVAVIHAANGWHAVMLGPYNGDPTVNLSELISDGVIPNDSFIKMGTQYNEMEWASPSWNLSTTAETSWSYGGSTFTMQQGGDNRRLVYTNPAGMPAYVTAGTVFFEGKRIGRQYKGTIYVYSTNCGPKGFPIVGSIVDEHTIEFHGFGPRRDDNCNVKYVNYEVTLTRILETSYVD